MKFTEKWDVYNANGQKIGKTTLRGKGILSSGEYHLVVHIWIVSSSGKILIQQRSENKIPMPGEWAATGGSALAGEDAFTAAQRELHEELGISSDENSLVKLSRMKRRNSLLDIFGIVCDKNAEDFVLQKSEVAQVRWVSKEELRKMINSGGYHNYGREYFDVVFKKLDEFRGVTV